MWTGRQTLLSVLCAAPVFRQTLGLKSLAYTGKTTLHDTLGTTTQTKRAQHAARSPASSPGVTTTPTSTVSLSGFQLYMNTRRCVCQGYTHVVRHSCPFWLNGISLYEETMIYLTADGHLDCSVFGYHAWCDHKVPARVF